MMSKRPVIIAEEMNPRYCAARACRCPLPRHPSNNPDKLIVPRGCRCMDEVT
jgi:hypothetical protein